MPKTENELVLTIPPMIDRAQIQQSNLLTRPQHILNFIPSSRSVLVAVVYLLLLAFAECLVILDAPLLGMLLHGLILVALLLHVFLGNQPSQCLFLLALSLAPLIRLLSLLMPLAHFPIVYCYVIVGAPLFVAIFLLTRLIGINRHMVGLVLSSFPLLLLVGLSGIILGYVEYIILRPAPLVSALRWELIWLPALILLIFTGFLEELIFRGLLQSTALIHLGRYSIPYVAVAYAVLYLGYRSASNFVFVFSVALFFGFIVKRSKSILGVSLAHGITNITLYLVFPFLLAVPAKPETSMVIPTAIPSITSTRSKPTFAPNTVTPTAIPSIPSTRSIPTPAPNTVTSTPIPSITSTRSIPTYSPTPQPTKVKTEVSTPTSQTEQPTPTLQTAWGDCSQAIPVRLEIGKKAQVVSVLYVRKEPGIGKNVLDILLPGSRLEIIGGPVCLPYSFGVYRWWNVQLSNGTKGWSAEGSIMGMEYFLVPLP